MENSEIQISDPLPVNLKKSTKLVLSVDGGGIRGIVPCIVIKALEEKTKKSAAEIFDLMAGVSTGAIVVAGLAKKNAEGKPQYSAAELITFYEKHGPKIFQSNAFRKYISAYFSSSIYSHENLENALNEFFGEETLSTAATKLLICTYDLVSNQSFMIKSYESDRNFIKIKDALRGATAAPTYFKPKHIKQNYLHRVLIDAAVCNNNPALCAYIAIKRLYPDDDVIIVSIGTGKAHSNVEVKGGLLGWIMPLLELLFGSTREVVNYQLENILQDKYIRIQSYLPSASMNIDKTSKKNLCRLKAGALNMIEDNRDKINRICRIVSRLQKIRAK